MSSKKPSRRQVLEAVSERLLDAALQQLAAKDLNSITVDLELLRPALEKFLRRLRDYALSGGGYPDLELYGAIGEMLVPKLLEGVDRRSLSNPQEILATPLAVSMLRGKE